MFFRNKSELNCYSQVVVPAQVAVWKTLIWLLSLFLYSFLFGHSNTELRQDLLLTDPPMTLTFKYLYFAWFLLYFCITLLHVNGLSSYLDITILRDHMHSNWPDLPWPSFIKGLDSPVTLWFTFYFMASLECKGRAILIYGLCHLWFGKFTANFT